MPSKSRRFGRAPAAGAAAATGVVCAVLGMAFAADVTAEHAPLTRGLETVRPLPSSHSDPHALVNFDQQCVCLGIVTAVLFDKLKRCGTAWAVVTR